MDDLLLSNTKLPPLPAFAFFTTPADPISFLDFINRPALCFLFGTSFFVISFAFCHRKTPLSLLN